MMIPRDMSDFVKYNGILLSGVRGITLHFGPGVGGKRQKGKVSDLAFFVAENSETYVASYVDAGAVIQRGSSFAILP